MALAMGYSLYIGSGTAVRYASLVDAAMEIKLEAAIGHLWFEEVISGDRHEDVSGALAHIDKSAWYARVMLEGGENSEGTIVPLQDPALRGEIEEVLVKILEFRSIADDRWEASEQSGIGSEIDQRFDALFNDLLIQADIVETELQSFMAQEIFRFRTIQSLLIAICLGLASLTGLIFRNYNRELKQGISALQKSEENMSTTLLSIGDAVITTDTDGCIVRMNPVAEQLTGWNHSEARGLPLENIFHIINSKTRMKVDNPVAKVLTEGIIVGLANHTALIARDGTEFQIADSGAPIRDTQGRITGVVLVFRDVTESYAKDQLLRQSEDKFRALYDNAPLSYQSLDEDGCFLDINPAWLNALGYKKEEVIGQNFADFLHPDWKPHFEKNFPEFKRRGYVNDVQFKIRHKDKHYLDISFEGCIGYLPDGSFRQTYCVFKDITSLKENEVERERLVKAIEQANESIVITDAEGIILYTNPVFEQITGYSADEALGLSPRVLQSGEHNEEFYKNLWTVISGGDTWRGRFINQKKDGSHFTEDATISPVFDNAGIIVNYVAVKRDVTEQLALEEQYHQAQKVESIGRLAGGVAHDLNNLLTPILGYCEILMADFDADDARRESVDIILRSGIRARDLVRQLLAFSRKQTLEYKQVSLNQILENFQDLLQRTIREDIIIQVTLSPETGNIMADIGQIEQVIMNLTVNAADSMPQGGHLNIETMPVELDEEYASKHHGVKAGPYYMLAISDTGHGIDDEIMERIFEPFFSTKGEQGTGLGLATVYGIIKQHGGNIWVYSEKDKGTTFKIYLPASHEQPAEVKVKKAETASRVCSETILLAEDDEEVRELARAILCRTGYTVLEASSGADALSRQTDHDGPVHLLLTDVVMPEMNGKQLFELARGKNPDLKVLFMSGYTDDVVVHRGVLDEGTNFIQKPFTLDALAAKVQEILDQKTRPGPQH